MLSMIALYNIIYLGDQEMTWQRLLTHDVCVSAVVRACPSAEHPSRSVAQSLRGDPEHLALEARPSVPATSPALLHNHA